MKNVITKLLPGLATICAFLSAAPYELGAVATLIAPEWKPIILKASLFAYGIGRLVEWIAKTFFPEIKVESPKEPPKPGTPGALAAVLALFLPFWLFGCQTRNWNIGGGLALHDDRGNSIAAELGSNRTAIAFRNRAVELRVEGFQK